MTPYERGYAAGLKAAAGVVATNKIGDELAYGSVTQAWLERAILSLPIVREADQRAKGEDSRTEQSCENGAAPHNPGEQELPAAAAKALPSESRVSTSDRDATEGTSAQQPASPGPCVVVPVEPTRAMEDAACAAGDNGNLSGQYLRNIWKAMLAAAKEEHYAHR